MEKQLRSEIIGFLVSHIGKEGHRQKIIDEIGWNQPLHGQINPVGPPNVFANHLVNAIYKFDGNAGIKNLLDVLRKEVGPSKQEKIDQLLYKLSTPDTSSDFIPITPEVRSSLSLRTPSKKFNKIALYIIIAVLSLSTFSVAFQLLFTNIPACEGLDLSRYTTQYLIEEKDKLGGVFCEDMSQRLQTPEIDIDLTKFYKNCSHMASPYTKFIGLLLSAFPETEGTQSKGIVLVNAIDNAVDSYLFNNRFNDICVIIENFLTGDGTVDNLFSNLMENFFYELIPITCMGINNISLEDYKLMFERLRRKYNNTTSKNFSIDCKILFDSFVPIKGILATMLINQPDSESNEIHILPLLPSMRNLLESRPIPGISQPGINFFQPVPSPAGDRVAFISQENGNYELRITGEIESVPIALNETFVVYSDMSQPPDINFPPVFSPDGNFLFFTVMTDVDSRTQQQSHHIYMVDLQNKFERAILDYNPEIFAENAVSPSIATMSFLNKEDNKLNDIYVFSFINEINNRIYINWIHLNDLNNENYKLADYLDDARILKDCSIPLYLFEFRRVEMGDNKNTILYFQCDDGYYSRVIGGETYRLNMQGIDIKKEDNISISAENILTYNHDNVLYMVKLENPDEETRFIQLVTSPSILFDKKETPYLRWSNLDISP